MLHNLRLSPEECEEGRQRTCFNKSRPEQTQQKALYSQYEGEACNWNLLAWRALQDTMHPFETRAPSA